MADKKDNQAGEVGFPVGTRIGKYEVVERRAIGGTAIVYEGYDRMLDRHVAIKQISTHLAEDPKFLDRFRKEAQILARLGAEQPAVVTIHEMIEDERGLFIVMEWIGGNSLETILNDTDGPVEVKAALQVIWRLAAALHDVHRAGIIHRDIKPGNIIICEGLRPKITDFGVAASLTGQTSMLLGTTKYMAPELFEGGEVDARADMYSLGMIAYEMLAGRPRFHEIFADIVRDPHSEALRWMKWHGNPNVAAPPLHEVHPTIPRSLSEIVGKMMAKDRDERFQSMEQLGRAIKESSSPRARLGARPSGRKRRKAPAREAGKAPEVLAETPDLGPGDVADELEVVADSTPTTAIPKASLSLRTKLILGAIIFLSVLGIVVGQVIRSNLAQRRRGASAKEAFAAAERLRNKNDYEEARKKFAEIRNQKRFTGTPQAAKSSVLEPLCEAHLAIGRAKTGATWAQDAAAAIKRARDQVDQVQTTRNDLDEWLEKERVEGQIDDCAQSLTAMRIFRRAMSNARTALEQGQFDQARVFLSTGEIQSISVPDPQERDQMLRKIDLVEFDTVYHTHLSTGDALFDDARKTGQMETFTQAQGAYQRAMEWVETREELLTWAEANEPLVEMLLKDLLSQEQTKKLSRSKLLREIGSRTGELQLEQGYRVAMTAADKALAGGKKTEELAALKKARDIQAALAETYKTPTDPAVLNKRIARIESVLKYEEGSAARDKGDLVAAKGLFEQALRFDPDNKAAGDARDEVQRRIDKRNLVAEGDKAFSARDYAKALEHFQGAAKLEPDPGLQDKIAECRFRILRAEADGLREQKKYDEAATVYERARTVKPSEGGTIDAIVSAMRTVQRYEQWIARGNEALSNKRWEEALQSFTKAKGVEGIGDTAEASQGIRLAKYNDYLSRGKRAMDQQDYAGAKGYFQLAKGQMATEEVDKRIAEADKKLKE